jgi:hypothetical protein
MDDDDLQELEKQAWAEFEKELDAYIAAYSKGIAEVFRGQGTPRGRPLDGPDMLVLPGPTRKCRPTATRNPYDSPREIVEQ